MVDTAGTLTKAALWMERGAKAYEHLVTHATFLVAL
jgi:phosphoribosylpyrophosphate synthetase